MCIPQCVFPNCVFPSGRIAGLTAIGPLCVGRYQVFDTSDLPDGVVNIVTGNRDHLAKYLAEHQNIEAMWMHGGTPEASQFVEYTSALNCKRTWCCWGEARNWMDDNCGQNEQFLVESVECKNIWIPMGEVFG